MKLRVSADISAKHRDLVVRWVKRCLREVTRKGYELPVDYTTACNNITVTIKHAGHRSSACAKGIAIDLLAFKKGTVDILEYPAFANDPIIGSRRCLEPECVLAATIAHEVSHFVQYRYGPETRWLQQKFRKPHGEGFQDIYRILRARVVNPRIIDSR